MSAIIVRWFKPEAIRVCWIGPDGRVDDIAQAIPPRPLAVVIGPPGPAGPESTPYVHQQTSASAEWIVNHNRGSRPLVQILSPGGAEVEAEIVHMTDDQFRVFFTTPQSGQAIAR